MNTMSKITFNKLFYYLSLIFLITLVCSSCYSREEREIRQQIGKRINLNGPFIYVDSSYQSKSTIDNSKIRILTTLDYNECYDCSFKSLINLQLLIQEEKNIYDDVNVWAITNNLNIEKAKEELRKWDLKTIIIVDSTDFYIGKNKLGELLHRNRTFIIDKNNRIVFVGNPVIRSQLKPYFLKVLNSLHANGGTLQK